MLDAGTSAPASAWWLADRGAIEEGRAASLLLLSTDPREEVAAWGAPVAVYIRGEPALTVPGRPM